MGYNTMNYSIFISCPKGFEYVLEDELKGLGLDVKRVSPQGVYGQADLELIYHLCLWSRLANRIQLILFSGEAINQDDIYRLSHNFAWKKVFTAEKTLAVEFHGESYQIRNTMFGAQVVKDGIVDYFRELGEQRPHIERLNPDIKVHAHLKDEIFTVSLDLTGYSMHQRGYRSMAGAAPIKENVAAAILIRAKWAQLVQEGYTLHDPFCGSGTVVIEAALMAANIAPGLLRDDQAFVHWLDHDADLWAKCRDEARAARRPVAVSLCGTDIDGKMVAIAQANAERAGVQNFVKFELQAIEECRPAGDKGLLIANPPYGERLSDTTQLLPIYRQLGVVMHDHCQGWQAAILTSNLLLAKSIGLRASKQYSVMNGQIECKLYCFQIDESNKLKGDTDGGGSSGSTMFANRLAKNYQHLKKWAARNQISCYRVYDADLPEYAFAIDIYNDHAVLQEYAAPSSVPVHKAELRKLEVLAAVPGVLGVDPEHLVIKERRQQKGASQYQRLGRANQNMMVREGKALLQVNVHDYLDTGLFLDHRPLRLKFSQLSAGTRFLNLFCYTASASVQAALAGARTTNVDLSNTYLTWAEDNFYANKLNLSEHRFVQADCLEWLKSAQEKFDVIFLDPPSFSNSKRMDDTLDIQRDHEQIITDATRLLARDGILYFSTNLRSFKLDIEVSEKYTVRDISGETIDLDFKRNQKIHRCFKITQKK